MARVLWRPGLAGNYLVAVVIAVAPKRNRRRLIEAADEITSEMGFAEAARELGFDPSLAKSGRHQLLQSLLSLPPIDGSLPLIKDVDPHDAGATRTRYVERGAAPYVPRVEYDSRIEQNLRNYGVWLIAGASKAGKLGPHSRGVPGLRLCPGSGVDR